MQINGVDLVENHFSTEAFGMSLETGHQFRTLYALGIGRPVVHFGGGHQLSALLNAGNDHRVEVGTGGIDGGSIAGRAGAEDDEFVMVAHDGFLADK